MRTLGHCYRRRQPAAVLSSNCECNALIRASKGNFVIHALIIEAASVFCLAVLLLLVDSFVDLGGFGAGEFRFGAF